MVRKRQEIPSENDLVICTITKVFSHGAFAKLDEYGDIEGFIHISEVASAWIKNIRDFVKEGQKTAAKVLAVDPVKGHIDISIRRVGEAQRKNKMQEWKRSQKSEKLLEIIGKEISKSLDEAYQEVGFRLEDKYKEVYAGLEEASVQGEEVLKEIGVPEEWIAPTIKVARENITIPLVDIVGHVDLRCPAPEGVEVIKGALHQAKEETPHGEVKLEIRYTKSPRFSIRVVAPDYKTAEVALKACAEKAISLVEEKGGTGQFLRGAKGEKG